jgi:hypothetical protein
VQGTLFVRACTEDSDFGNQGAPIAYNLNPRDFFADPINDVVRPQHLDPQNRLIVRVQSSGARVEEADALIINVANEAEVASSLGQALAVGPTTNVRATLALNETCPLAQVQIELDGTLTFTQFGSARAGVTASSDFTIDFNDRLVANFTFTVVDRRQATLGGVGGVPTSAAVAGQLSGFFNFVVIQGKVAQTF